MSLASRCGTCSVEPRWEIVRIGDVAVTWSCDEHVAQECGRLQRDFEVTELRVKHVPKAREWAGIGRALARIADDTAASPVVPSVPENHVSKNENVKP